MSYLIDPHKTLAGFTLDFSEKNPEQKFQLVKESATLRCLYIKKERNNTVRLTVSDEATQGENHHSCYIYLTMQECKELALILGRISGNNHVEPGGKHAGK